MGDRTRREHDTDAGDVQTADAGETAMAGQQGMTFTNAGFIPPVLGWTQGADSQDTASDIAFGVDRDGVKKKPHAPPLADNGDLQAQSQKTQAEKLLKTKDVTSPEDAVHALEILLTVDAKHQGKVIDELDDKAFENLIDRLPDGQRERLTMLVDASQKPKRKLKLWGVQHMARARHDLQRYEGNFGTEDEQTEEQADAQARYERRKQGVGWTQREVNRETDKLLAKDKDLTVEDIDKMRARKDKELNVEIEHNINLITEEKPREDGTDVVWEKDEIEQLDKGLDKLPARHTEDGNSVPTYARRANRGPIDRKGGQYHGDSIDIYDHSHDKVPGRENVDPIEYSAVHEVGHEAASENKAAFKKFEKTAGWKQEKRADLEAQNVDDEKIENAYKNEGVTANGKHIHKQDGHDLYYTVDETALPTTERWKYAGANSDEHFAEMYAMAVETPELLYSDYIDGPANDVKRLQAEVAEGKPKQEELAHAQKIAKQRRELYDIIRNDIFKGDKGTASAVARLRQAGVRADAITAFERRAARVSTPKQIEELEQQALRDR